MCKECFEYSEKCSDVMEDNHRLLEENKILRNKLNESLVSLKQAIEIIKTTKEGFLENHSENIIYRKR